MESHHAGQWFRPDLSVAHTGAAQGDSNPLVVEKAGVYCAEVSSASYEHVLHAAFLF